MTPQEAIRRIEEHNRIHAVKEYPFAIKITEALDIAVKALEKQIPKNPIGKHTNYKCPICNRRVRSGKGSSSFGVDYFCQRCGQALDWSDTE